MSLAQLLYAYPLLQKLVIGRPNDKGYIKIVFYVMITPIKRKCQSCLSLTLKGSASLVKNQMLYQPVPEENRSHIKACKELIAVRHENLRLDGFGQHEIEEMLDFLCVTRLWIYFH